MSILKQVFGDKYNDEQLVTTVEQTLAVDPLLRDPSALTVTSKKGVIQLTGKVHSASEKTRVETLIATTLNTAQLKYHKLINDLLVT